MNNNGSRAGRPKGAKRILKGICRIAKTVGVTPQHLLLVIKGERVGSAKLLRGVARQMEAQGPHAAAKRQPLGQTSKTRLGKAKAGSASKRKISSLPLRFNS